MPKVKNEGRREMQPINAAPQVPAMATSGDVAPTDAEADKSGPALCDERALRGGYGPADAAPTTPHGEGIYVASRVKHAPIWLDYRDRKRWPIVSTWIDEAGDGETADFGELWQRIRAEIGRSKVLVFYADGNEDFPFKGALVEVGMALAMGKPVFAVLDRVMIEGRTMRPVGSWLRDRNVRKFELLPQAMEAALQLTPIAKSETSTIEAMQAKIDSLMLEYCPDEMTEEQKAKWAAHQKPASCPHAAPFVYCEVCKVHPCPLGLNPE
jgi:hypothetical protein